MLRTKVFPDSLEKYVPGDFVNGYANPYLFLSSDLGMVFIEVVAYMGAVLSMKADMLANENFLPTVKHRNNLRKLLALIGVSLRGPIGSAANAELTLPSPVTLATEISIPAQNRVVTITSPEDGGPLNFTLYKVSNGSLVNPTQDSAIVLDVSESTLDINGNNTSSVWENLALLEGAFVSETGTFNTTDSTKKITLTQSPVIEASTEVFIDDGTTASGAWTRVDNLFSASGASDRIYQVVYDDNFRATVVFGDGILGTSPANGASYIVTYRVGGGTRGRINSEVINANIGVINDSTLITGIIENTSIALGGQDAETVEHAKQYAPLTFRRQDRLVTLDDYSSFANSFIGTAGTTGKARASTRDAYSSGNIIDIYLLQRASNTQLQQASIAFKTELLEAISPKKMITDEVVIVDGVIRTLDLIVTIRIDIALQPKEEEIKSKVRNEILDFFNVDNTDFGEALVLAELNRAIFRLDEVRFSSIDNLLDDVIIDFNEIIQLNNLVINVQLV